MKTIILFIPLITICISHFDSNEIKRSENHFLFSKIDSTVDCSECNVEVVKKVRFSTIPEEKDILVFLSCLNKPCALNIEFSQASNYSLFLLIQNHADLVMEVLIYNMDKMDLEHIEFLLKNPVSEEIDVFKSLEGLKATNNSDSIKDQLIHALEVAALKRSGR